MSIMHGEFVGGPNDGLTFTHDGVWSIDTCMVDGDLAAIHLYVADDESRTRFVHRGVDHTWSLSEAAP